MLCCTLSLAGLVLGVENVPKQYQPGTTKKGTGCVAKDSVTVTLMINMG